MEFKLNMHIFSHSPFAPKSHFKGTFEELLQLVQTCWDDKIQGYREGVFLVSVPPDDFMSAIIHLKNGDKLCGVYASRLENEEPRKQIFAIGKKVPADFAKVVLYRGDLAESKDPNIYELVSIIAGIKNGPEAMDPWTLCYNHFNLSGGTPTNMDAFAFEKALKESFLQWKNYSLVAPSMF